MNVCIVVQATLAHYDRYTEHNISSIGRYLFPEADRRIILFNECRDGDSQLHHNCTVDHVRPPPGYPVNSALFLFDLFLAQREQIRQADYCYTFDVDTIVVDYLREDFLPGDGKDFVGIQHFLYADQTNCPIVPSTCSAFVPLADRGDRYWQSCIFGGRSGPMLEMAEELGGLIRNDAAKGAQWGAWEEPYLNYFYNKHRQKVRTLPSNYAMPTCWWKFPDDFKTKYYAEHSQGLPAKILHLGATGSGHKS